MNHCEQHNVFEEKFKNMERSFEHGEVRFQKIETKTDKILFRINAMLLSIFLCFLGLFMTIYMAQVKSQADFKDIKQQISKSDLETAKKIAMQYKLYKGAFN